MCIIEFTEDVLEFGHVSDELQDNLAQDSIVNDAAFSIITLRYDDGT